MKSAEEIVNLFELVRNCSNTDWAYNKKRLIEIIQDFEQNIVDQTLENHSNVCVIKE